jgi:ABC-type glutathione transport system ATPase component
MAAPDNLSDGIRIEGLRKRYGEGDTAVDALKNVNMQVAPGEVVGLVGPPVRARARCSSAWAR